MAIAFIPIRKGSTRVPNKNIKLLEGKPLVYWSLLQAQLTPSISKVYLATNYDHDQDFMELIKPLNKVEIYNRQEENADSQAFTICVIQEFLNSEMAKDIPDDETFITLEAICPIRPHDAIEQTYQIYKEQKKNCAFTVIVTKEHILDWEQKPINFGKAQRSQDFKGSLQIMGGIGITSVKALKETDPTNPYQDFTQAAINILPSYCNVDIDTIDDWDVAEVRAKRYYKDIFESLEKKLKNIS